MSALHREGDREILDAIREAKPPFSPESIVEEFAALLPPEIARQVTEQDDSLREQLAAKS